ncbi:hypothetical protein LAUMK13_05490 [Mycobacterium innocens]|uniref:Uncharacterized protein n=1 Tax=Mycobacterium innocens TaxID=2341083 RepID=A0A498QKD1_9MYCO|nr:hypothetical protein LAUMK13_05490 [Mycobacterium innocens]
MGRSTARRMLTGRKLPDPAEQVDGRTLRPRSFSDDASALLEYVWVLMGMPCGKYLVVMVGLWLPLPADAGDVDKPFVTEAASAELKAMSAATVDRYLKPVRGRMRIKGISTTKPSPLLRNSITTRTRIDLQLLGHVSHRRSWKIIASGKRASISKYFSTKAKPRRVTPVLLPTSCRSSPINVHDAIKSSVDHSQCTSPNCKTATPSPPDE